MWSLNSGSLVIDHFSNAFWIIFCLSFALHIAGHIKNWNSGIKFDDDSYQIKNGGINNCHEHQTIIYVWRDQTTHFINLVK